MEAEQYALGTRVSGFVLQEEQTIMQFAMGCNDPSAGRQLLDRISCNMRDEVRRVKTYQRTAVGILIRQGSD